MDSSLPLSARSSTSWKTQVTAGFSPLVAMAASASPKGGFCFVRSLMSKICSLLPGFLLCLWHCLHQVLGEPPDRVGDSIPQSLEQSVAQGEGMERTVHDLQGLMDLGTSHLLPSNEQSIKVTQTFICGESQEPGLLMKGMKENPQSLSIRPVKR